MGGGWHTVDDIPWVMLLVAGDGRPVVASCSGGHFVLVTNSRASGCGMSCPVVSLSFPSRTKVGASCHVRPRGSPFDLAEASCIVELADHHVAMWAPRLLRV